MTWNEYLQQLVFLKSEILPSTNLQEDRNGSVVLASSRHMKEEYEMNMTIPRAKVPL